MTLKDPEKVVEMIVNCMQNQADEACTTKAEVDLSGGVDSAVVLALACKAFGKENVVAVYSGINSSKESAENAYAVANAFQCSFVDLNLNVVYYAILEEIRRAFDVDGLEFPDINDPKNRTVFGSLRSCLRAPIGRFVNRCFGGGIRQGTGNRDEDELLRFYQKGGDGEVDSNWIAGLFKGEVWELAQYLGVPDDVINAKPTPDLWGTGEAHDDEDELEQITGVKLTYTRPGGEMGSIEWVLRENDKNGVITGSESETHISGLSYTKEQKNLIQAVRDMERVTRHKALPPPYLSRDELIKVGAVE